MKENPRRGIKEILSTFFKFMLFTFIGVATLYFLYYKLNASYQAQCQLDGIPSEQCNLGKKMWSDLSQVNIPFLLLMMVLFAISNVSRAKRWQMMFEPLGYQPRFVNAFLTVMLGYFANLGLPRIGEAVRAGSFAKYERIPVERVMGTIVLDRVLDMLSFATVLCIAFLFEFDIIWGYIQSNGRDLSHYTSQPIALYGLLFLSLLAIIFITNRKYFRDIKAYKIVKNVLLGFWEGVAAIKQLKNPWQFLFHSAMIWLMYYLMTYVGFWAFAPTAHLSAVAALVVFVFGSLGVIVPTPGGMGSYHALVVAALLFYGINQFQGFTYANVCFFTIQILSCVFFGIFALIMLPIVNKNKAINQAQP